MSPPSISVFRLTSGSGRVSRLSDHVAVHIQMRKPPAALFLPKMPLTGCFLHGPGRKEEKNYPELSAALYKQHKPVTRRSKCPLFDWGFWRRG
ncbi:hypothetical protein SLA2020_219480 [Shorea laevis]